MFLAVCYFSVEIDSDSRLVQRIKDKVFSKFKLLLAEVGEEGEVRLAAALVNRDENYIRSLFSKMLEFIEESEGVRLVNERIEVMQN